MKKIIAGIIISISLITVLPGVSFSQTPTGKITQTPTPKPQNPINDQINNLKDRIASRVAQLNLVEKRGVIGKVTEVADTQITITDSEENTRFIDVDELTKFSSPSAEEAFGISDITEGEMLGVIGLYNKQTRRVLARFVDVLTMPTSLNGVVTNIDDEEFTITVKNVDGNSYTVDVENITKTNSFSKDAGLEKSGFSQIEENQRIFVVGFLDKSDSSTILASRILLLPEIPVNPVITENENSKNKTSSGSGKKLTPLSQ